MFDALDAERLVDSVVYHCATALVIVGKAQTHQELIDRFAEDDDLAHYVRMDIFRSPTPFSPGPRIEFETIRAAVDIDVHGDPCDNDTAWSNIIDAWKALIDLGLPAHWLVQIDGKEVKREWLKH